MNDGKNVQPFETSEYRARFDKPRVAISDAGIDALVEISEVLSVGI